MRVKLGIDPTAPDLHLGHAVVLKKLRQLQDQGHEAVFIVGDFTAMIGDPSGREGVRPPLSREEIKANTKKFLKQAGKIIDLKRTEIHYNSRWLRKLKADDFIKLLNNFTLQQIVQREDFSKRLQSNQPIALAEPVYPVLQAYDSVMVRADLEIGGKDQTLNLMAGRDLMRKMGMKPQETLTLPLLIGTDGVKKMSKSVGNYIALDEKPNEMYGKIMTVPDELMPQYYELLTDVPFPKESHPKEAKMTLAKLIVGWLWGEKKAIKAEKHFMRVFGMKKLPSQMAEIKITNNQETIINLLLAAGIKSKSGARRLIEQGGVRLDDEVKKDPNEVLTIKNGSVLQIGRRRFYRLRIS